MSSLPKEIELLYEQVEEAGLKHWKCKKCGCRIISIIDAIRHAITHDERYRKYLKNLY